MSFFNTPLLYPFTPLSNLGCQFLLWGTEKTALKSPKKIHQFETYEPSRFSFFLGQVLSSAASSPPHPPPPLWATALQHPHAPPPIPSSPPSSTEGTLWGWTGLQRPRAPSTAIRRHQEQGSLDVKGARTEGKTSSLLSPTQNDLQEGCKPAGLKQGSLLQLGLRRHHKPCPTPGSLDGLGSLLQAVRPGLWAVYIHSKAWLLCPAKFTCRGKKKVRRIKFTCGWKLEEVWKESTGEPNLFKLGMRDSVTHSMIRGHVNLKKKKEKGLPYLSMLK